jgi:hypothetical protein
MQSSRWYENGIEQGADATVGFDAAAIPSRAATLADGDHRVACQIGRRPVLDGHRIACEVETVTRAREDAIIGAVKVLPIADLASDGSGHAITRATTTLAPPIAISISAVLRRPEPGVANRCRRVHSTSGRTELSDVEWMDLTRLRAITDDDGDGTCGAQKSAAAIGNSHTRRGMLLHSYILNPAQSYRT